MDYYSLLEKVYNEGIEIKTRGTISKELTGVNLEASNYNFFATPIHRPFEDVYKYLYAELCWYFSGERDISRILKSSKFWGSIRNPDNTANSNYGNLVFYRKNSKGISSFNWALERLKEDKETRKAIVLYNDRELFYEGNNDLICNQYQHFLIRNNELICFVGLRSSDAIYGLTFNIPWWSIVQQQLRFELLPYYPELKLGKIEAFISSSHIYQSKWSLVKNILGTTSELYFIKLLRGINLNQGFDWYEANFRSLCTVEKVGFSPNKNK